MPLGRKSFSVYPRKVKKGKIYYAQFRDPDGSWGTAKSTGQTSRSKAEAWCNIKDYPDHDLIQKSKAA